MKGRIMRKNVEKIRRNAAVCLAVLAFLTALSGCQRGEKDGAAESSLTGRGQEETVIEITTVDEQAGDEGRAENAGEAGDAGQAGDDGRAENAGQAGDDGRAENADQAGGAAAVSSGREQALVGEPIPAMEARDETVYVVGSDVNLRAGASTSSQVVAVLQAGEKLRRTGYEETWSRVEYNGAACYIASRYVSASEPRQPETTAPQQQAASNSGQGAADGSVTLDASWKYAEFSKINSGTATLYKAKGENRKGITVCVNAGHGTSGGSSVKTLCHPDGTPKVTGGTTGAGATSAVAVSGGMTFADGTAEAKVTLAMAMKLKGRLLDAGYDVLMIRESDDVQLDNVARTVIANNMADCHIALHWDSTSSDKGAFYMSVPNVSSYRAMEPVKSNWEKHNALGESLVAGLRDAGVKIFSGGSMEMDLTQTSYSTVPSIDIELGDKVSDHSDGALDKLAGGLLDGINRYFAQ